MSELRAHPLTGEPFTSPVGPGTGWPGDLATRRTPVAEDPSEVVRLAAGSRDLATLSARSTVCRACRRLVQWREHVAREDRRASFADQPYWGRPVPAFGDSRPFALLVGLAPAANGANRTGRNFTGDHSGDFLYAALHRTGLASQATSTGAGDGLELAGVRIVAAVRCAPPANAPTPQEKSTCRPWLLRELELLTDDPQCRLRSIMAIGAIGWDAALAAAAAAGWQLPTRRPKFAHASRIPLLVPAGRGRPERALELVGCYHVSPHNTFTGRLTPAMIDEVLRSL